jgi:DNA-binding transcriptional MerR regulator
MLDQGSNNELPPIPAKRYFTIGEVSDLCLVKPHVLRYWEQEFPNLKPVKRRGNRRYYQRHDVLVIRQIRGLLYDQGFTIGGARQRLETESVKRNELEKKSSEAKLPSMANSVFGLDYSDAPRLAESRVDMIRNLRLELESVLNLLQA